MYLPNARDPDHRGEASCQFVPAKSCTSVHTRYDLHTFKANPLQIVVIESIVRHNL